MKLKAIKSSVLILLGLLGIIVTLLGPVSNNPIIPAAHATPPNNFAALGLFSETAKSNAVLSGASGSTFSMDINLTDAGSINGFDINITFTSASLHLAVSPSAFSGAACPASDRVVTGSPAVGSTLKSDARIKYVDTLGYNYWAPDSRDSIIIDSNANGRFDTGEPVIFGITPANLALVKIDAALKYFDTNGNNVWDTGEPLVVDPNGDNLYDAVSRCIFDRIKTGTLANVTSNPNWYRLSIVDQDTIFPFVNGNGILFRLKFTVQAASVFSVIHISTKTRRVSHTIRSMDTLTIGPLHSTSR